MLRICAFCIAESKGCALPNTWKDGASDVGTDQDRERYRVKVAFLISIRFQPPIHP
jgi:hypothetical protein